MSKHLSHSVWIAEQFKEKYLTKCYRNAFIHSSIIEGVLINESGMDKFDSANKFLLCAGKINSAEFCVFDEIRRIRNQLAHTIFKKRLSQDEIDKLLNSLIKNAHKAYILSTFLDEKLFKKYNLKRPKIIEFN